MPLALAVIIALFGAAPVAAQPLGTFSWQLRPYCNVVTFLVTYSFTPTGPVYTLDGFDDQCGAATRAAATGVAFPNPDGSVGMGLSIVSGPGAEAFHLDARIALSNLSGTWVGEGGIGGAFVYNTVMPGLPPRPDTGAAILLTQYGAAPRIVTRRAEGTPAAPAAVETGQTLGVFGSGGHTGTTFTGTAASIVVTASEDWTAAANGARLSFLTTPNGGIASSARMTIAADGNVGIGTLEPEAPLHVEGVLRVGSCTIQTDGNIVCLSDARFKQDIRALSPVLDRLTRLEPVQYSWRVGAFPGKGFEPGESFGLVAQDVEAVLPELVTTDAQGYKAVSYGRLPLLAVQALKEMKARMDAVQRENADLAARLAALEAAVARATRVPDR
jgi:hypothetical protein